MTEVPKLVYTNRVSYQDTQGTLELLRRLRCVTPNGLCWFPDMANVDMRFLVLQERQHTLSDVSLAADWLIMTYRADPPISYWNTEDTSWELGNSVLPQGLWCYEGPTVRPPFFSFTRGSE